jgi:hypothetical protein
MPAMKGLRASIIAGSWLALFTDLAIPLEFRVEYNF